MIDVFSLLLQALPFVAALLLGLLVPVLLIYLHRSFVFGLSLVVFSFLIDTLTLGGAAINLGINLFSADLIFLILSFSAATRFLISEDCPPKNKSWLFFIALVMLSILTGLASYGLSAGVQGRSYFYFIVAGSYAMSFPTTEQRLLSPFKALAAGTLVLICIALYRWVVYYLPITSLLPPGGTYNIDGPIRVIYSNHALVIAQVLVAAFFFAFASPSLAMMRFLSPLLLGMVVVLQHRSVWLATMAGVLVRMLLGRTSSGSASKQMLVVGVIAAVTAVPLVFNDTLSGVTQQVSNSAAGAFSGGGTGGERLQSWEEIVKNWYKAGVRSIAIGQSFGADTTRTVVDNRGQSRQINYAAHNLYVQTLFNTGLLGLLTYGLAIFYVLSGLYKMCKTPRNNVHAEILLVMLAMQVVYYVPYGEDYLQALIFGIALAFVAQSKAPASQDLRGQSTLARYHDAEA